MMQDLRDKSFAEIKEICAKLGLAPFKAKEVFRAVHQQMKSDPKEFTALKAEERKKLSEHYFISHPTLLKLEQARGVKKAAFKLEDSQVIETVFMDYEGERKTICISSQAGCPLGCAFCATGEMGLKRNLTTAEMVGQVYYFAQKEKVSNVVFMGMGEPFLNYNNVIKAARILNNELGLNIAARKIIFSTIGVISGIEKLSQEKEQFRLAWSLVATSDRQRKKLIKARNLPPIKEVISALQKYQQKTRRRITIEYVVLAGVNDREEEIKKLARISQQLDSQVNLIPFNPVPGKRFKSGNAIKVKNTLDKLGVNVTIRKSLGQKISAACGQLRAGNPSVRPAQGC